MEKFIIHYGCYLDMSEEETEASSIEAAESEAYYKAIEVTEDWLGMHGFECSCSVDNPEHGWSTIQTGGECCRETIEQAAEYWAEEIE